MVFAGHVGSAILGMDTCRWRLLTGLPGPSHPLLCLKTVEPAVLPGRFPLARLHPLIQSGNDHEQPDEVARGPQKSTGDLLF